MTNAALKMAAPGELCAQSKKLMAFCNGNAKSIKAMRQHIGVTHDRMNELLSNMLGQRLIWRQSNGMYKTCTNKLQFIDEQPQAANSLLALTDDTKQEEQATYGELDGTPDPTDITELDLELVAERPLAAGFDTNFNASDFELKPYDLAAMANEFEAEQERGDQHVIDNLDAKQRVINYCQMLLSPRAVEMRRCLDELQMDLAVIRLQQERSVL